MNKSINNFPVKRLEQLHQKKHGKLTNNFFMEYEILWYESLESTMKIVNDNIKKRNFLNKIIVANYQTMGHGRFERKWYSKKYKDLLASIPIVIKKEISIYMPIILSLSIFETLSDLIGPGSDLKIKWPNDILLNKKKISGMITENIVEEKDVYINFGVGINVNSNNNDLSGKDFIATSLQIEESKDFNIEEIIYILLNKISKNIEFDKNIFLKWKKNLYFPNKEIFLNNNKNDKYHVDGVDDFGNLKVSFENKKLILSSDEISFHD